MPLLIQATVLAITALDTMGSQGRLLQRQYLKKVRFGCLIILGNYWLPCTRTDQRALVWDLTTTSGLELIANGGFSVDANWVKGDHWSIANNYTKYAQYKPVFNANSTSVVHYGNDTITINGHNFSDGDEVTYLNGGGVNIGGLTTGTNYFIVNSTTNTFKLAATSGGTAINFTAPASIVFNGDTEKDTTDDKIVFTHPFQTVTK